MGPLESNRPLSVEETGTAPPRVARRATGRAATPSPNYAGGAFFPWLLARESLFWQAPYKPTLGTV